MKDELWSINTVNFQYAMEKQQHGMGLTYWRYVDFKKGIDKSDTAGDRTLVDGVKLNIWERWRDEGIQVWKGLRKPKEKHKEKTIWNKLLFFCSEFGASGLVSMTTLKVAEIFLHPSLRHRSYTVPMIFNLRNCLLYWNPTKRCRS